MALSPVGKRQLAANLFVLFINLVVIYASASVNSFQDFFYMADVFPFMMSLITLVFFLVMLPLDFFVPKSFTTRAPFHIGAYSVLAILWLAVNAFSTSRWRHVPFSCDEIPEEFDEERLWCRQTQVLKSFVWVEWVSILLYALLTLRYTISQSSRGNKHIFSTPFSRYTPRALQTEFDYSHGIGASTRPISDGSFFTHNRTGSTTTAYAFAAGYGSTDINDKAKLSPIMAQSQMSMAGVGATAGGHGRVHPRDVFTRGAADSEFVQYNERFA